MTYLTSATGPKRNVAKYIIANINKGKYLNFFFSITYPKNVRNSHRNEQGATKYEEMDHFLENIEASIF